MIDILKEEWDNAWDAMKKGAAIGAPVTLPKNLSDAVTADLSRLYPIGRMWTPDLSVELSQQLLYTQARYGLDTAVTVEHLLSECMATVSRTLNISERLRSATNFSHELSVTNMIPRDVVMWQVALLRYASEPRITWDAEILPSGIIRIRSRFA